MLFKFSKGICLTTPCETRWNSQNDSLVYFLTRYKSLNVANTLMRTLGLPNFTKEDIELLQEYMKVVQPLAIILDIFQRQDDIFLGIGIVLPLLTRLKNRCSREYSQTLEH